MQVLFLVYFLLFTKAGMQVLPVWDKKYFFIFLLFHYVKMQHIVAGSHADFVFILYLLHCVKVRSVVACSQNAKRRCLFACQSAKRRCLLACCRLFALLPDTPWKKKIVST
jgi:hypothetical protein